VASEHWFRWHHGCVTDPKWRVIASRCVTCVTPVTVGHVIAVWAVMMENASLASPRGELSGWDDEDVAVLLGFGIDQVKAIREAMQGKTLAGSALQAWEKRQPKREDSSSERTKKWRDAQATPVTQRDAKPESVTRRDAAKRDVTLETETETETEKKEQKQKTAPEGDLLAGVSARVAADFRTLRSKLRAPITPTAVAGIQREAAKAGLSFEQALETCCERGWRGFKADWLTDEGKGGKRPPGNYQPMPGEL
jgi:hypothetical protein